MSLPRVFMLCDLECPFRRYLQVRDWKRDWKYEFSPTPPGVSVCGADEKTWDASQVPEECPYLSGIPKLWERK